VPLVVTFGSTTSRISSSVITCDAFGLIGATFRELGWKALISFERAVPMSPNAWTDSRDSRDSRDSCDSRRPLAAFEFKLTPLAARRSVRSMRGNGHRAGAPPLLQALELRHEVRLEVADRLGAAARGGCWVVFSTSIIPC
jgi:hypothetical protein